MIKDSIPHFNDNNDIYIGIELVLQKIDDKHSFFFRPDTASNPFTNNSSELIPPIDSKILEHNIGYLKIFGLLSEDSAIYQSYALKIRNALIELDKNNNLKGWIIDLTNNNGGRAGTFTLGLAPFFTDSIVSYSINAKGDYIENKLLNNTYFYGKTEVLKLNTENYVLKNANIPIAVLIGENTASLAELIALNFSGIKNSILIGKKTIGFTTDLMVYSFKSGAQLGFSINYMCDRNKNIYKNGITPNILCEPENNLDVAINWINNQTTN